MRNSSLLPAVVALALAHATAFTQDVRPVFDDVGFCWDIEQMKRLVALLDREDTVPAPVQPLVAGISPHDDFLYAGRVYYPLMKSIRAREAVIFGVTHGTVRKEIGDPHDVLILDDFRSWRGVRGEVQISPLRERIRENLPDSLVLVSRRAHMLEHSIEALVPFLQYFNPGITITPIMVTAMPFERMADLAARLARVIADYMTAQKMVPGRDIVFLVSSDANHYGRDFSNTPFGEEAEAHDKGTALDRKVAGSYLTGELSADKLRTLTGTIWGTQFTEPGAILWCGRYSIPFGMLVTIDVLRLVAQGVPEGRMLLYSDTYTGGVLPLPQSGMGTTAPFSLKHWVGFFSASYTLR